jgi:ketosteroid isomerase-like protein
MSQENVELAKRAQDLFESGGIEAALVCFAPDVVAYPFPEWVEASEYRGHDGLRALVAVWTENFDEFEFANQEFHEVGDSVLILGETAGVIKGSGVPIRQPLGSVYSDFRGGKIGKTRNFLSWSQALDAVGLREQPLRKTL